MTEVTATELVYSKSPPHAPILVDEASTPDLLLERCAEMHQADKVAERRKKRLGILGIVLAVVTFFTFFAAGPAESPVLFGVAAGLLVLTIVSFVLRSVFGRADVDDRKLDVPRHLLETLRSEILDKRLVKLWMDFGSYENAKKLEDTTKWYNKTGTLRFVRPWLRMTFTLLDGTEVALHARTSCKRKQKQKRKYTKMKDTVIDEVSVFVKPPKDKSLDPAAADRARAALSGGAGVVPRGVKVKPRVLLATFRCGPGLRIRGRGGWSSQSLEALLDGRQALMLVLFAVRAMRAAQVR